MTKKQGICAVVEKNLKTNQRIVFGRINITSPPVLDRPDIDFYTYFRSLLVGIEYREISD